MPSLQVLSLAYDELGPAGAEAFAAPLHRGAMPKLKWLFLAANPLGSQGVTSLTLALRKLPALKKLTLTSCEIGDEGVASLVNDLGKDDFKALLVLFLPCNKITDVGCATLARVRDAPNSNALPKLDALYLIQNPASAAARQAAKDALGATAAGHPGDSF